MLLAIPALATAAVALALGVGAVSVPEAPARVDLDVMSGDEVAVTFAAPLSDGGSAVQSYEVCMLLSSVGSMIRSRTPEDSEKRYAGHTLDILFNTRTYSYVR